jgi:hypothetical protein
MAFVAMLEDGALLDKPILCAGVGRGWLNLFRYVV